MFSSTFTGRSRQRGVPRFPRHNKPVWEKYADQYDREERRKKVEAEREKERLLFERTATVVKYTILTVKTTVRKRMVSQSPDRMKCRCMSPDHYGCRCKEAKRDKVKEYWTENKVSTSYHRITFPSTDTDEVIRDRIMYNVGDNENVTRIVVQRKGVSEDYELPCNLCTDLEFWKRD